MRPRLLNALVLSACVLMLASCGMMPFSQNEPVSSHTQEQQDGGTAQELDELASVDEGYVTADMLHAWDEPADYQDLDEQCRYHLISASFTQDLDGRDASLLTSDLWLTEEGTTRSDDQWIAWIEFSLENTTDEVQEVYANNCAVVAVDPETLALQSLGGEAIFIDPVQTADPDNSFVVELAPGESKTVTVGLLFEGGMKSESNDLQLLIGQMSYSEDNVPSVPNNSILFTVEEFWDER